MIKRIRFRNYGPFEEAGFALEPLTVIVGPNASGKSIALTALDRLRGAKARGIASILAPMRKRGSEPAPVEIGIETRDLRVTFTPPPRSGPVQIHEAQIHEDFKSLPRTLLLRLEPEKLREPSYLPWEEPRLREDGFGLATVLADMKLSESEEFESVLSQTRAIVPTFEDLRFERVRVGDKESPIGNRLKFNMKGAADLPPAAVSDGTVLVLGLLTILKGYSRKDPETAGELLVLIDELEHGLHPKALGELVSQLRRLAEESDVQILATSHSPYLVDWLKPEEVRMTSLLEDGSATIRELGEHPEFERWKEEMRPGEFWSTVGEDWS